MIKLSLTFSEFDRRLKETSLAAMLKLASDLIEDNPPLLSYVRRKHVRASPKSPLKMH